MTFTTDPPLISDLSLIPGTDEKADLDAPSNTGGKLVVSQVPNISISSTTVVADETERLGLDVQEGDLAIQTDNSTSFIFTGGDNVAANWQEVQFDAVGAIDGKDINPRDITPRDITASGDISLQDLTVTGAINGADTSAATAGEALTSNGSGGFNFSPTGGFDFDLPQRFNDTPTFIQSLRTQPNPTGSGDIFYNLETNSFVKDESEYYYDFSTVNRNTDTFGLNGFDIAYNPDGSKAYEAEFDNNQIVEYTLSTAFDPSTRSTVSTFSTQSPPRSFQIDESGRYAAAGLDDFTISIFHMTTPFDMSTMSLINNISLSGREAGGLYISTELNKILTGEYGSDRLVEYSIDILTPSDASITERQVDGGGNGESLSDIAVSPDFRFVSTLDSQNGNINVYEVNPSDISDRQSINTFSGSVGDDGRGLAYAKNGLELHAIRFRSGSSRVHTTTVAKQNKYIPI